MRNLRERCNSWVIKEINKNLETATEETEREISKYISKRKNNLKKERIPDLHHVFHFQAVIIILMINYSKTITYILCF